MNCCDLTILPSKFEGFGIVVLETQCSQKECIVSKYVPKEADLELDLVKYLDVKENNVNDWVEEIKKVKGKQKVTKEQIELAIKEKGLDIIQTVDILEKIYLEERKKNNNGTNIKNKR